MQAALGPKAFGVYNNLMNATLAADVPQSGKYYFPVDLLRRRFGRELAAGYTLESMLPGARMVNDPEFGPGLVVDPAQYSVDNIPRLPGPDDWALAKFIIPALTAGVGAIASAPTLAGAGLESGGAAADMFGQGAVDLGNFGAADAGMLDPSLITSPVAPVSTGAPVQTSVGDPFIDAYTPTSANVPQGTWTPTPGVGTVASAINKLFGTSLNDADVSTGARVGTTAAGLLAGSGAAGGADPLPGSDTSGLDAARARTRASITGMFDGQDPRYQGIRDSVLGFQKSNLDRDREEAARKLKFSLLRTGNAGGSLQVDEGSKLNRTYDRGLLDATNLADQAAQSARSSDASTKLDLLGRVDSGLDQDAATASAAEQMRLAGDRATSQGLGTALGNVFADAGLMFQTDAARRGLTDARKAFQSMFSTVPGSSGGSYTGITGRA